MDTEIFIAAEKTVRKFTTIGPIFVPFYNRPGKNIYWQTEAFDLDPVNIIADITSGSPVLINGNLFIGLLNTVGCRFAFDGFRTLTVTLEAGQKLMIKEECDPYAAWDEYNTHFETDFHEEKFWQRLEFCTWVEQSKQGALSRRGNYDVINEKFVYSYVERIEKMGLPKGKLTIDDGWAVNTQANGKYTTGNWEIDRKKFPHFEKLIDELTAAGYDPGLWFNPFCATPDSKIIQDNPAMLTDRYFNRGRDTRYLVFNEEILRPYYREIFGRYIDMGIRKLKLDIAYSRKYKMIDMLRVISEEVRAIDPSVEIECHIPDIFAMPYCSTVRMNDVSISDNDSWKSLTVGHFDVAKHSAAGKIINLDHIGSNADFTNAWLFMMHWHLLRDFMKESKSYPVVSFLPDFYSDEIRDQFVSEINEIYGSDGYRK